MATKAPLKLKKSPIILDIISSTKEEVAWFLWLPLLDDFFYAHINLAEKQFSWDHLMLLENVISNKGVYIYMLAITINFVVH
jgi:hypothetical protein